MNDLDKLLDEIADVGSAGLAAVEEAADAAGLDRVRVDLVGKKGRISAYLKQIVKFTPDERKIVGPTINNLKVEINQAVAAKQRQFAHQKLEHKLKGERIDVSLPVAPSGFNIGRVHPLTRVMTDIYAIFGDMGFSFACGPDIESDYYNFTALNFPPAHPARDMHDTFFFHSHDDVDQRLLLRTHTSPVQIRVMEQRQPPIRVVAPGRVYRHDSDQTHTPMFHQLEALAIDRDITMAHLKGTILYFCERFFAASNLKMRFRPSFFPFTEPSLEVDINCTRADGKIIMGEGDEWLEIMGCGMVHPNVLRNCQIDPDEYQGFAWGVGIDRLAMLKYGIPDLRDFFASDARWLNHYGFAPFD